MLRRADVRIHGLLPFCRRGPGFAVFAAMTLLLLYLMRVFRRRYSRLRPLFRQQAVWLAMQNQFALISCLVLYLLAVLGVLAFSSGWLRVPAVLAMTAFCLHLLFARRGRVYLLGRGEGGGHTADGRRLAGVRPVSVRRR